MNRLFISLFAVLILTACGSSDEGNTDKTTNDTLSEKALAVIQTCDSNCTTPFWIIAINAYAEIDTAVSEVLKLQQKGEKAGYLWIPDYSTLSGKKMYCVFIGPFSYDFEAGKYLSKCKKDFPGAYAVKVDHEGSRLALYSAFDIRKDDKKMNLVLAYAKPADLKAYFDEGGEDWGWFTSDVGQYINENLPDVYYGSVYDSWLTDEEIAALEKELNLSNFGYVMIRGKEKSFTEHDMPDGVITVICDFFGYEKVEMSPGD